MNIINNEDLRTLVHQFDTGCLNPIEFLLKVQVSPQAVQNLLLAAKLPAAAIATIDIGSLMKSDDEVIEEDYQRAASAAVPLKDENTELTAQSLAAANIANHILTTIGYYDADDADEEGKITVKFYTAPQQCNDEPSIGICCYSKTAQKTLHSYVESQDYACMWQGDRSPDILWMRASAFNAMFGTRISRSRDFCPEIVQDYEPDFTKGNTGHANIAYARELVDWLAMFPTSALLRSFKFYKRGTEIGIYTSDTGTRAVLKATCAQVSRPHMYLDKPTKQRGERNHIIWLTPSFFHHATNLTPPEGIVYEEKKA